MSLHVHAGSESGSNAFIGVGDWLVSTRHDSPKMGALYSTFIFHLSFATTATTIVSGAMAERTHLRAYIIFSLINTVIYCVPSHWIVSPQGFLQNLGEQLISTSSSCSLEHVHVNSSFTQESSTSQDPAPCTCWVESVRSSLPPCWGHASVDMTTAVGRFRLAMEPIQ